MALSYLLWFGSRRLIFLSGLDTLPPSELGFSGSLWLFFFSLLDSEREVVSKPHFPLETCPRLVPFVPLHFSAFPSSRSCFASCLGRIVEGPLCAHKRVLMTPVVTVPTVPKREPFTLPLTISVGPCSFCLGYAIRPLTPP